MMLRMDAGMLRDRNYYSFQYLTVECVLGEHLVVDLLFFFLPVDSSARSPFCVVLP